MSTILADIRRAMVELERLPAAPVFMSSKHFPADHATTFKAGEVEHFCAGPAFWAQVPKAAPGVDVNPLTSIEIVDLDLPSNRGRLETICATIVKCLAVQREVEELGRR